MLTKDLSSFAETNWCDFQDTISVISTNAHTHIPLVEEDRLLFHFDKISESLYVQGSTPTSADGMNVTSKNIEFIEFKSGFRHRITKHNFDEKQGLCKDTGKVCTDYWNLFFKKQEKEIDELLSSIRCKAIESYITLEKHILPKCENLNVPIPLKFTVVIDEEEVSSIEDTLAELVKTENVKDNHFSAIRSSLRRLTGQRDVDGNDYYYDSIEVLSATDFKNRLHLTKKKN